MNFSSVSYVFAILFLVPCVLNNSFAIAPDTTKQVITIALPSEGNPPYSYGANHPRKGIYNELFISLFANTPYQPKFVFLSAARIRSEFLAGKVDIECCPLPSWRQEESNISNYTSVVLNTEDILVFPKNKTKSLNSLKGQRVATVQGYGYLNDHLFTRFDVNSELTLLKVIARKRLEVGIVDKLISIHLKAKNNLDIELGGTYERAARPIRVHHSKSFLIAEMNSAIARLKEKRVIDEIVNQYITTY